jgi:hypothetical protein
MAPEARAPLGAAGQTLDEIASKQDRIAERQLHDQCVSLLCHTGVTAIGHARMDKKSTFTEGWPDLTFALRGRACAVELKVGQGKPTSAQSACMARLCEDGWHVAVVYSAHDFMRVVGEWKMQGADDRPQHTRD